MIAFGLWIMSTFKNWLFFYIVLVSHRPNMYQNFLRCQNNRWDGMTPLSYQGLWMMYSFVNCVVLNIDVQQWLHSMCVNGHISTATTLKLGVRRRFPNTLFQIHKAFEVLGNHRDIWVGSNSGYRRLQTIRPQGLDIQ